MADRSFPAPPPLVAKRPIFGALTRLVLYRLCSLCRRKVMIDGAPFLAEFIERLDENGRCVHCRDGRPN